MSLELKKQKEKRVMGIGVDFKVSRLDWKSRRRSISSW